MAIQTEQEALNALDAIHAELAKPTEAAVPDLAQLCSTYRTIKPFLEGVLWLIERIPVVGTKIAVAVRFLTGVADVACPIQ